MKKIVVVAPHPDDETLGCGGTLLKHKASGDELYWIIVTNVFEPYGYSKSFITKRQDEIRDVSSRYGFTDVFQLDYPTTTLNDSLIGSMVERLSHIFTQTTPDQVYLPNRSDVHTDHAITFTACMSATKHFRQPSINKIMMYECLSETEFSAPLPETAFTPNMFVDTSAFFDEKLEIMKLYSSELMEEYLPRSPSVIEAQARTRGGIIGKRYAEAFVIIKEIL